MTETEKFCSVCGEDVTKQRRMKDREGEFYCIPCYTSKKKEEAQWKQQVPGAGAVAVEGPPRMPASEGVAPAAVPAEKEKLTNSLGGGLAVSGGILAAGVVIMAGLHLAFPGPDGISAGQAIGAGIIHAVFLSLRAVGLIVSLVVAIRLTGGAGFGYFGPVVIKALGLLLGLSILEFFVQRFESFEILSYGFRGLIMIVALIMLFDLDILQTMILSAVNMVMGMLLTVALAATLFSVAAIGGHGHHAHDVDDDHSQIATPADHARHADRDIDQ